MRQPFPDLNSDKYTHCFAEKISLVHFGVYKFLSTLVKLIINIEESTYLFGLNYLHSCDAKMAFKSLATEQGKIDPI